VKALASAREVVRVWRLAVDLDPADPTLRQSLALGLMTLGKTFASPREAAAQEAFAESLGLFEQARKMGLDRPVDRQLAAELRQLLGIP
jgi:hypothetical protein